MSGIRWVKFCVISCLILSLFGCAHKRSNINQAAINDANAAYRGDDAQAAGLGEESRFGEEARMRGQLFSKRVYYFDFDSNVVHEMDKPAIFANANYLVSHPHAKVIVEGHTDPRGSREYNIGLGERRARAIAALLASRGVRADQIRVVSYGAEKLASLGRTEVEYQKDRRVILVYMQ